jgi:hypothetical protein
MDTPEKHTNSIGELKNYFSTPERPVSTAEFAEMWKSMTTEEKDEFKLADLK